MSSRALAPRPRMWMNSLIEKDMDELKKIVPRKVPKWMKRRDPK
jgi:hypothetical protein